MKAIVFGGAGAIGSEAVRILAASGDVSRLLVADINEKAAAKLAREMGSDRVEAVYCDAGDREALVALMKEADVSLGCIGPFYEYEEKMIRAAAEARRSYVSVCDDFDAAEAALKLDKSAKKAGITVLTGMGWTPGLSNVLARKGMEILERTSEIHIAWVGAADDSEGRAVVKHVLHSFGGEATTYAGGRWKKVIAGSGREWAEFPAPVGKIRVYHVGHPEPVTIPHFFHGLETVTLKGAVTPEWFNHAAIALGRLGLTNTPKKRDAGASIFSAVAPAIVGRKKSVSGILVRVVGEKRGAPATVTAVCMDHIKRLAGVPAAVGTLMVGRCEIAEKGVLSPEVCVPTDLFLKECEKRGLKAEFRHS